MSREMAVFYEVIKAVHDLLIRMPLKLYGSSNGKRYKKSIKTYVLKTEPDKPEREYSIIIQEHDLMILT